MAPTASSSHTAGSKSMTKGIAKAPNKGKASTKMTRTRLPCNVAAFSPTSFVLSGADASFKGGNMYIDKGKDLTLSIKCKIATPLTDEESYSCYRLSICSGSDHPETAALLSSIDDWTVTTVNGLGKVPSKGDKLYPLLRPNGWSNFKVAAKDVQDIATSDGRDWSQIKGGETGTLTLNLRGIWRSEEIGGYGLMVKLGHWTPDTTTEETIESEAEIIQAAMEFVPSTDVFAIDSSFD